MSLRLYDTRSRSVRDFTPLRPGEASMYICGITVQGPPHIGHIRFALAFDVLRRWLTHSGYDVTYVRNVTDIDDKILIKSAELGRRWWEFAYENELACTRAYDVLGCLPPTYEPRATGHIPEMVALIKRLIDAGHAYPSGGDVYFDVRSYADYGSLSGQRVDELQPAADTDTDDRKHDPRDFALWKGRKPGEPETAAWPTPWGEGRPGWHLECSAMATKYLGPEFDIHGGGIDLRFPHHENELAQSAAAGDPFARYWLHNGWVTMAGEKMSKSLGNTLLVDEVVRRVRPVELRYYLVAPQYRSTVAFSEAALAEHAETYRRLESFVLRALERVGVKPVDGEVPPEFAAAMDDDLGVPAALAVLQGVVREGNAALAKGDDEAVAAAVGSVRSMLDVLGLDPLDPLWSEATRPAGNLTEVIDTLVRAVLEQRQAARERKDYAVADALRDQLKSAGINIEDSPSGPRWTLERS